MIKIKRGDIYYVRSLNTGATGSEQKSDRPAVIISNDVGNKHSPVLEIVYLTGMRKNSLPTHVAINSAKIRSTALCEQVFTISKSRIDKYVGHVSEEEQKEIDEALMISIGIKEENKNMNELQITGKQMFSDKEIPVVLGGFGADKKCMSDKTISEIHGTREVEIRKTIARNITRFKENIDFIDLKESGNEVTTLELLKIMGYTKSAITQADHIYLLSERGYAKLIKIMDSDLAWEIHDKLIDEYFQLRDKRKSPIELLELEFAAIKEVDAKIDAVSQDLNNFKQDMPILGIEEGQITSAVKRKGVQCLGGKDSNAYRDKTMRSKLYSDLYRELKHQFNVDTYKAIKRSQCGTAIEIIEAYEPPLYLKEMIHDCNAQEGLDVA